MNYTYLLVDLCSVMVPFIFAFHPRLRFSRFHKPFIMANLLAMFVFVLWDMLFTKLGVWGFNERYLLGFTFINLPLEEVLFFLCIPYSCLFTFYCLRSFFKLSWPKHFEAAFTGVMVTFLFILGFFNLDKLYTSSSFISTGAFLLMLRYYFRVKWLSEFFTAYLILLVPFFIVNGVLTGTGLEEPVVWYNDAENLGIRLMTIPVEDSIYGFELLLLNQFLFERFSKA